MPMLEFAHGKTGRSSYVEHPLTFSMMTATVPRRTSSLLSFTNIDSSRRDTLSSAQYADMNTSLKEQASRILSRQREITDENELGLSVDRAAERSSRRRSKRCWLRNSAASAGRNGSDESTVSKQHS